MTFNKLLAISASCVLAVGTATAAERSMTLEEVLTMAESNSKTLQMRHAAVDVAEEGINVAKNDRLPSIDASLSFSYIGDGWMSDRNFKNGARADMPHFGDSFALKASQVVYAGGAINTGIEISELQKQIAELELADDRQNVRFLLCGYYLQLCQLRNQADVYKENIAQTEALIKEIKASYEQGTALRTDITRYELQLENLQLGLTHTENQQRIINRHITTAIGLDQSTTIVPDTTVADAAVSIADEQTWQRQSGASPALQLAGKSVEMSLKQQNLAKAGRRPSVALVAANEFNGPILIEVPPINKNFNYWYVGVGITYKFDALYKNNKKLRQAKAATFQAEIAQSVVEENIANGVHDAYVNLDEAFTRLKSKETSVKLAQENYSVVRNRYLSGLALVTDMLDAANVKLSSELDLTNARIDIVYQHCLLKKTIGNL